MFNRKADVSQLAAHSLLIHLVRSRLRVSTPRPRVTRDVSFSVAVGFFWYENHEKKREHVPFHFRHRD